MSERFYPPTEEELLKQRILTPQPSRAPYSPVIDSFIPAPPSKPPPAKPPGCTFTKPCQLPDGIIHYTNPTGYVPLELIKEYGHFSLLGGREADSQGAISLRKISGSALPVSLGHTSALLIPTQQNVANLQTRNDEFTDREGVQKMVMKIRLRWYDKHSSDLKADEYSADIDDVDSVFEALGLSEETAIYADVFNVLQNWITTLQPYFQHAIEPSLFDYQISFRYQGTWPPKKEL